MFPGFPVELGGAGELHAAFLTESRTRELADAACRKSGSHQRTWDENDGAQPPSKAIAMRAKSPFAEGRILAHGVKALEKPVFGPCTLVRTWGTRPEMSGTGHRNESSCIIAVL
jgi:hypothetical protein